MFYERTKNKWRIELDLPIKAKGSRKRFITTFYGTKKEAAIFHANLLNELKNGIVPDNKISFEDFSYKWIEDYAKPNLSPKTVETYQFYLKRINKEIGFLRLNSINPLHLVNFYNNLRKVTKPNKLKDSTIQKYYSIVNAIFNKAIKWQFITDNPNRFIDKPKVMRKEADFFDEEEVDLFIEALQEEPIKIQALLFLALDSGMRRSELTGLEWEDIDFEEHFISINKSTQRIKGGTIEKSPKTNTSIRKIRVSNKTIEILSDYKKECELLKVKCGKKWQGSKKVFITSEGANMYPDTPSWIFRNMLKKHGIRHIKFHSLRHTSISLLLGGTDAIDAITVSRRVGHSSTTVTQGIYAHVLNSANKRAADKMDNILS